MTKIDINDHFIVLYMEKAYNIANEYNCFQLTRL